MRMIQVMCQQERFSTDFFAAGGATWLPDFLLKHPYHFEEALDIIRRALNKCQAYGAASDWVKLTLKCQEEVKEAINQRNGTLVDLRGHISSNAGLLLDDLKNRDTGEQAGHQASLTDGQDQSFTTITSTIREGRLRRRSMSASKDNDTPKLEGDATMEWSPNEREAWATMVSEVIRGFDDLVVSVDL
jgi:hypothetical protein